MTRERNDRQQWAIRLGASCYAVAAWWFAMLTDLAAAEVLRLSPGVVMVVEDRGLSVARGDHSHQGTKDYWIRKILDCSSVPPALWREAFERRLMVYTCVHDHSTWTFPAQGRNGLNERIEIVVNGRSLFVPTSELPEEYERMDWHCVSVPKAWLARGQNEILFRKAQDTRDDDDYFYVGIDQSAFHGYSALSLDASRTWRTDKQNVPGTHGEYMVRLLLLAAPRPAHVRWDFGRSGKFRATPNTTGSRSLTGAREQDEGAVFSDDESSASLEVDVELLDAALPFTVRVEYLDGAPSCDAGLILEWQGTGGDLLRKEAVRFASSGRRATARFTLERRLCPRLQKVVLRGAGTGGKVAHALAFDAYLDPLPPKHFDMAPSVKPVRAAARPPKVEVTPGRVSVSGGDACYEFRTDRGLILTAVRCLATKDNFLKATGGPQLFMVEVGGRRVSAADFAVTAVRPVHQEGRAAVAFDLLCASLELTATLTVTMTESPESVWTLTIENRASQPQQLKIAFPVLTGLVIGSEARDDYYLFPWRGGVISPRSAEYRVSYGEFAFMQLTDVYDPSAGVGLAARSLDKSAQYKLFSLTKAMPGEVGTGQQAIGGEVEPQMYLQAPLPRLPATSVCTECLRRDLAPGQSWAPPAAAFDLHTADWHQPMQRYRQWFYSWAHRRPWPNRLYDAFNYDGIWVVNIHKKGRYVTDYLTPLYDLYEYGNYWEWAPIEPGWVPDNRLTPQQIEEGRWGYEHEYTVTDEDGNRYLWNNKGDYDGYNKRWGGLQMWRGHLEDVHRLGYLTCLYVEAVLANDCTKIGRERGALWGVIRKNEKYVRSFGVWNMCSDTPGWRNYLRDTCERLLRETGAAGLRLDEYGHPGWVCHSTKHEHTFGLPGHNVWQQAIGECTRACRQAMDKVAPAAFLMTEFPGTEVLGQYLDGCISYDLGEANVSLRPAVVNLYRYYFPRCKLFELCYPANEQHARQFRTWLLFNGSGAFGSLAHKQREHIILKENADAFNSRECIPLVPTLARRVCANCFPGKRKTLYGLYNDRNVTAEGEVLALPHQKGYHYVDLWQAEELSFQVRGNKALISARIPPKTAIVVAALPRLLVVRREEDRLSIRISESISQPSVSIASAGHADFKSLPLAGRSIIVSLRDLSSMSKGKKLLKLFEGEYLADAVVVR